MNIVLIGMRGSGKTTVGAILGRKLSRDFIDMDSLIMHKAGFSLPEFIQRYGWVKFRDIEAEITREVARLDNIINATGGGVITKEENTQELKRNGILVWLLAGVQTLMERIGNDTRPPLVNGRKPREDMEITYNERKYLYQQAADLIVDTENKTAEKVAVEIMNLLVNRGVLSDD